MNRLHPIMRQALAPHIDPAALWNNLNEVEAARKLRPFVVQIKNGATVTHRLEVMGESRVAVQKQHESLCGPGEYCWVVTPEEAKAAKPCGCGCVIRPELDGFDKPAALEDAK